MFEGSESVEVEGGSTESTVASSISACKKVKKKKKRKKRKQQPTAECCVFVLGWRHTSTCVSPRLSAPWLLLNHVIFLSFSPSLRLSIISASAVICLCVSSSARDFHFLLRGAGDTQRLCNKRNSQAPGVSPVDLSSPSARDTGGGEIVQISGLRWWLDWISFQSVFCTVRAGGLADLCAPWLAHHSWS